MLEDLTFLEEGEMTAIDDNVKKIAAQFSGPSILADISRYLEETLHRKKDSTVYRRRTGGQILGDRYFTGCTDIALGFIVLARAKGIPTRYVETVREKWLKNPDFSHVGGHIFVDVFFDGKWEKYEPLGGFSSKYFFNLKNYHVIGKGLDFKQVYVTLPAYTGPQPVDFTNIWAALRTVIENQSIQK